MKVAFIVFKDVMSLDIAGPMDILDTVAYLEPNKGYDFHYVSDGERKVQASGGLTFEAIPFDEVDPTQFDTVIVPGSPRIKSVLRKKQLLNWLASANKHCRRMCSVCSGAFLLAQAGILEGKRAATHWQGVDILRKYYPKTDVDPDSIYVQDGSLWTSAGGSSGIDLALALVKQDFGEKMMLRIAKQLVVYAHRPGSQQQFSTMLDCQMSLSNSFNDVLAWMQNSLTTITSIEQIADYCGMSLRNFHRKFVTETGQTPAKYLEQLRLEAAANLLQTCKQPLKSIASQTGFRTELRLIQAFKRFYQLTPSEFRHLHCLKSPDLKNSFG